jgi:hypothetical protein
MALDLLSTPTALSREGEPADWKKFGALLKPRPQRFESLKVILAGSYSANGGF